jgi:pimeloyl-ACP methyl ester carboxylesterase
MTLAEFNLLAELLKSKPQYRGGVVSIHGMNTRGAWQKQISSTLQDAAFRHIPMDYGLVRLGVLLPGRPGRVAKAFTEHYEEHLSAGCKEIFAIGHSLGTRAIGAVLQTYPDYPLRRIVLRAAVLRMKFPWTQRIEAGQVGEVLNEACPKDIVPTIACFAAWKGGRAGRLGFTDLANGKVHNRFYPEAGHSGLLEKPHCRKTWIPFLLNGTVTPHYRSPKK